MNVKMELIWIADRLDRAGMTAEANSVDSIIKFAQEAGDEIWTDGPINSAEDDTEDDPEGDSEEVWTDGPVTSAATIEGLTKRIAELEEKRDRIAAYGTR